MDKRTRVGLFYSYNENWIGGTYYRLNLIRALNCIPDEKKPVIVLMTDRKGSIDEVKAETGYPYLDHINLSLELGLAKRVVNKLFSYIGVIPFSRKIKEPDVDLVYPNYDDRIESNRLKKIYWIPDFQEVFLPEFFTAVDLQKRKARQRRISETGDFLVFSSRDAQSHYNKLYPNSRPEQFVLNFAVTHPDLNNCDEDEILSRYNLEKEFYFIPNQFWVHKNHITVLKALKEVRQKKKDIQFVFSGKEHDHRSKDYVQELKSFVAENELENSVKFLGFIPRDEQLVILKNSLAVIQPSLFEGWSTVVEDAKAQNKYIFLSDLPVHYEQIKENCTFFERLNHQDLATKLLETEIKIEVQNYTSNIEQFGNDFLKIIEKNTFSKA